MVHSEGWAIQCYSFTYKCCYNKMIVILLYSAILCVSNLIKKLNILCKRIFQIIRMYSYTR